MIDGFRRPIDGFRRPIDGFRRPIDGFRRPIDAYGGPFSLGGRASRLNQPPELDDGFEHAPELLDGQPVQAEGELEDAPTPPFPPGRGAAKRKRRSAGAPELRNGIAAPERKRRIMPKAALVLGEGLAAGP